MYALLGGGCFTKNPRKLIIPMQLDLILYQIRAYYPFFVLFVIARNEAIAETKRLLRSSQ